MELEVLDTLEGTGLLGALPEREALAAKRLAVKVSRLPDKERLMVRRALATCPAPPVRAAWSGQPADLAELSGWWSDVKKKAGKALKKVGAAKVLAAATAGLPLIGPIVGPLAMKAANAAEKAAKGDKAGADKERQEIRQIAEQAAGAAAVTVQTQAPPPGQVVPPMNKTLLIGAGLAVAAFLFMRSRR